MILSPFIYILKLNFNIEFFNSSAKAGCNRFVISVAG
jgi:hypothetical protein